MMDSSNLTIKKQIRFNYVWMWIRDALLTVGLSFASTSVLQSFFLEYGLTASQIAFQASMLQAMYLISSIALTGVVHRFTNHLRGFALTLSLMGLSTLLYLPFCFVLDIPVHLFFICVLITTVLVEIWDSLRRIFDYQVPCQVMDVSDYSFFTAVSGILTGISGLLPGLLLSWMYTRMEFMHVTAIALIASAVATVLAASCALILKRLPGHEVIHTGQEGKHQNSLTDIRTLLHNREFLVLILPNFMRGFGMGVFGILPTMAIVSGVMEKTNVALLTSIGYLATFISCGVYAVCGKKHVPVSWLCAGGAVLMLAMIPMFSLQTTGFLILYFVAYCGYNVVNYAIPDMVYRTVAPEIMSAFHTWRMALTTVSNILATMLVGALLESTNIPIWVYMLVSVASTLYCCVSYAVYFARNKKPGQPEQAAGKSGES